MNLKRDEFVWVTNYPQPRRAQVIRACPRSPNRWVVRLIDTGDVLTIKEKYLRKVK